MGFVMRALKMVLVGSSAAGTAKALSYTVGTCKELLAIPTPMADDTHIMVEGDISCRSPRTIMASGPYAYLVTSEVSNLTFRNVRFSIKDGADFFMNLASQDGQGTASFIGGEGQRYHGGAFKVDVGASLTFGVPVSFSGNSVVQGKRGGAIYSDGYVTFELSAKFENNQVATSETSGEADPAYLGCGGAVYNGPLGLATFQDVTWFTDNTAAAGTAGGAVCNNGVLTFESRTYFAGNVANGNVQHAGGEGGAVYTGVGASTTFMKKANFRNNRAGSTGGAVHSAGLTRLQGHGIFSGNSAVGWEMGRGGHVYTSGVFEVEGDATFRTGLATQDGGALFVDTAGDASFDGNLDFIGNRASRQCHDVYDASSLTVCLSAE